MSLQNVEKRLKDHKSALVALGTEATSALLSFEEQQQHISLQSLSTMVLLDSLWKLFLVIADFTYFLFKTHHN
jgi:hypothetical protein